MNFLKRLFFHYVTPVICVFTMSTASLEAQAQVYSDVPPCCETQCCSLLPALLAAAAGVGIAFAVSKKGKHGKQGRDGDCGCQPGSPFERDAGQSLTFNFSFNFTTELGESAPETITAFVEQPDGTTLTSLLDAIFIATGTSPASTSITVPNPLAGTYYFGYRIGPATFEDATAVVADTVVESQDNTVTAYLENRSVSGAADQQEITHSFVYRFDTSTP